VKWEIIVRAYLCGVGGFKSEAVLEGWHGQWVWSQKNSFLCLRG